jgi:hypothetical protein
MRLSKTNREILTKAYGPETQEWIGKVAKMEKEKVMVAGKKCDMIVLTPKVDVQLDEPEPADKKFTGTKAEPDLPF